MHLRYIVLLCILFWFFFFNDTATTEIYTLSLHDALPIFEEARARLAARGIAAAAIDALLAIAAYQRAGGPDRKSTRLNSSHRCISYAVFCLKKKKKQNSHTYDSQIRRRKDT